MGRPKGSKNGQLNLVFKICPGCNNTFGVRPSKSDRYTYCSLVCRQKHSTKIECICEACGVVFATNAARKGRARFCSYACAYRDTRITFTCAYCGCEKSIPRYRFENDNTKFCSHSCAAKFNVERSWNPGNIGKKIKFGYRTDIELMVESALQQLNIEYEFEKKIGRYFIDFYLPTMNVALECDGWHHIMRKESDAIRDENLLSRGIRVIRIADGDIRSDAMSAVCKSLSINHQAP